MQFLNPLVLLGLAAAAVPLLLHLLQKRKLRTVEFSTLRFLKEIQKTTVRTIKLRQILLLILRTLIIVFIVLAFARPALRGTIGGLGSHAHSTVVILLDNSLSMDARDARGQIFSEAQLAATEITNMLEEGDNATLVRLAEIGGQSSYQPTHDFTQLKRAITETSVAPHSANIGDGLRIASNILSSSQNPNKEVYIITDEQSCSFDTSAAAQRLTLFDDKTRFFVIRAGASGRHDQNLSIDSLHISTGVFEKGKPVDAEAFVRNNGNADASSVTVHLLMNGKNSAQRSVTIPAHGVATVPLSAPLESTGMLSLSASVEDDAIEMDNTRYAALLVPEKLRVAVVAQNPAEEQFIKLALLPEGDSQSDLQINDVPPSRVAGMNFSSYDVVMFASLPQFSASDAKRFHDYIEQGGGAVIFGGGDAGAYNATAAITALPRMKEEGGKNNPAPAVFGAFDDAHPLFKGVFERQLAQGSNHIVTESPKIQMYMHMTDDASLQTIIRLANGAPFLAQKNIGQGMVVLCAVPPTAEWSDLPFKTIFLPLVMRSVLYTGAQDVLGVSQPAEEAFDLSIRKRQNVGNTVIVRAPDGTETKLQPKVQPTSAIISLDPQKQCGVYSVLSSDGVPLAAFAVNPEPKESDLATLPESEINKILSATLHAKDHVAFLQAGDNIAESILQARFGVELWKFCIIAALLCALAEMVVARTYKNEITED
ncbi:MAG TPA: BatA domain-containing protein [Candidatus Kapabacteria bacterium]|nr:BatA domain-containing protein [Candidatus Kapabacteria bacterium]